MGECSSGWSWLAPKECFMRWLITAIALLVQTAPLPPAYPRPGTTKLLENNRVLVWDISWLKQQYPLHRHPYALTGVYYTDGDRMIVSESGERRPVHTAAWDTAFQLKGVTHIEEGASRSEEHTSELQSH